MSCERHPTHNPDCGWCSMSPKERDRVWAHIQLRHTPTEFFNTPEGRQLAFEVGFTLDELPRGCRGVNCGRSVGTHSTQHDLFTALAPESEPAADSVDSVLRQRGKLYGRFDGHAAVAQDIKNVIRSALHTRAKTLAPDQQEALDMICHKIARIINGDPDYDDSWVDIAGYAQLVVDRLRGEPR